MKFDAYGRGQQETAVAKPDPCPHRDISGTGSCTACGQHYTTIIAILQTDLAQAQRRLAERRDIEQAKGRLMHHEGLTEAQAYVRIRSRAMDERRTMGAVAFDILVTTPAVP